MIDPEEINKALTIGIVIALLIAFTLGYALCGLISYLLKGWA